MLSDMKLLCETMYFGPIPFFRELCKVGILELEINENYNKSSYRNRMEIATSNGKLILSIPLLRGKHQGQPIREVQIDNNYPWQSQHWKSLQTAYSKSPFFEYYAYKFEDLYDPSNTFQYLWDFNMACIEQITSCLQIPIKITTTSNYSLFLSGDTNDIRNSIRPKNIHQKPALNYNQTFEDRTGFIPHLSILDLLFCKGPESVILLNH